MVGSGGSGGSDGHRLGSGCAQRLIVYSLIGFSAGHQSSYAEPPRSLSRSMKVYESLWESMRINASLGSQWQRI